MNQADQADEQVDNVSESVAERHDPEIHTGLICAVAYLESPLPVGKDVAIVVHYAAADAVVATCQQAAGGLARRKRLLVRLGTRSVRANHLLHLVDCMYQRAHVHSGGQHVARHAASTTVLDARDTYP